MYKTYFLVAHGSRDPRPHFAQKQLAQLLRQRLRLMASSLGRSGQELPPLIGTGTLELGPLPLHQQLQEFGESSYHRGCDHVEVLPLFLVPGVHVVEDIPAEVQKAQAGLGSRIKIEVQPYLGSQSQLGTLLQQQILRTETRLHKPLQWILLAHGSRRSHGNEPVIALAQKLGAMPAYWSVSPSLESQVTELVRNEQTAIGILPYFLFSGGITDTIAASVVELTEKFPTIEFYLGDVLGVSVELADILVNLLTGSEVLNS